MTARTWFNGQPSSTVPADNRGLAYGDGLFETVAVRDGRPRLWQLHLDRLHAGCRRLAIGWSGIDPLKTLSGELRGDGVLKIVVARGASGRGYASSSSAGADTLVQWFPVDDSSLAFSIRPPVAVTLCRQQLARQPVLAGLKHLNRLEQVLARAEWNDPHIAEGLMLDTEGQLVEAVSSNLFMIVNGQLLTPSVSHCGVAGVMRRYLLETAGPACGLAVVETAVDGGMIDSIEELFLTNSLRGITPVRAIVGRELTTNATADRLQQWLCDQEAAGAL